jgi:hypothetical protein
MTLALDAEPAPKTIKHANRLPVGVLDWRPIRQGKVAVTLFSDGIASRLLVVNLIFTLEEEGMLSPAMTQKIFEASIRQANSFLATIDQVDDASTALDIEALDTGLDKAAIEHAIDMLQENYKEIRDKG